MTAYGQVTYQAQVLSCAYTAQFKYDQKVN